MREKKEPEKINIKNLNKCIKEYKKLGHYLNILAITSIIVLAIYLLNKLHIFGFMKEFTTILIPLFVGLIISWLVNPIIDKLTRKKIPRVFSCIIVYGIVIGIIILFLAIIIPSFISQIKDLINAMPDILKELKEGSNAIFKNIENSNIQEVKQNIFKTIAGISEGLSSSIPKTVIGGTKSFISVVTNFVLGLMFSFYLSYDYHKLTKKIYQLIPKKYHNNTNDLINRINHSLRDYVQGVLIVMLIVFISQTIGLSLAGLKAPLIFALFCALTDIIPYFGPWIGAIPAIIVGFTISPLTGIFTIISIVIVQTLENNFYQPLIMGHTMKLHPVVIMLGLLIFGHFFGIIGMIVATPLVATLKIIWTFTNEKLHIKEHLANLVNNN